MSIRIGTAGWHYLDWYAIVYPDIPRKSFKELDYLSRFIDMVEINSTFYRPANEFMGSAWVRKVAHNPRFKFTAKLWQRFTHDRRPYSKTETALYRAGIDPMAEAGKLGALLCQFPWSFKNDETGRNWLSRLIETFHDYPLIMEVRHSSWDHPSIYEFLHRHAVGIASIDQPVIGKSIPLKPIHTGQIGYVRMHGRNYKQWFAGQESRKQTGNLPSGRYDYLYTNKEIEEIAGIAKQVSTDTQETYVVQNNHPWGQAVANALQLKAALGESDIDFPATLLNRYPFLRKIGNPVEYIPDNNNSTSSES
ncbi:hypothetical protein BVY01_04710 [bacterium I07]|nr:hypothetical protein BVY01_04710 [bacterium I07]